jgi:hypothetical protein
MFGAPISILTGIWVEAAFPATSTAVPLTAWLAPLLENVCCGLQVEIPERVSEQLNVTVTEEVFQPFTGTGDAVAVIVGGVRSRLTVPQTFPLRPSVSVAVPQKG